MLQNLFISAIKLDLRGNALPLECMAGMSSAKVLFIGEIASLTSSIVKTAAPRKRVQTVFFGLDL